MHTSKACVGTLKFGTKKKNQSSDLRWSDQTISNDVLKKCRKKCLCKTEVKKPTNQPVISSRIKQVRDTKVSNATLGVERTRNFRVNKIIIAHSLFTRPSLLLHPVTKRFLSFPATATILHRAQISNQLFLIQKMPKKVILDLSV